MLLYKLRFYRAVEWCWKNRHRHPLTVREIVDDALAQAAAMTGCTCDSPSLVGLVRENLNIVEANDAACNYAGRSVADMRDLNIGAFILPRNVPLMEELVRVAKREGQATGFAIGPANLLIELRANWLAGEGLCWIVAQPCCPIHHEQASPIVLGAPA